MKHFVAALMCLLLISCSESKSRFSVDPEASCTNIKQLADRDTNSDVNRDDGDLSGSLPPLDARRQSSVSPYEIKQYVEEHQKDQYVSLAEYWNRLGIDTEEWKKYGRCEASIFDLALGPGEGTDVMLRLYDDSGWSMGGTRYVFFKPAATSHEKQWRILGHIDFQDQRGEAPEHRVITSGSAGWLVLTILVGRGSGYGLQFDYWYEIDDNGVRLVLSYPSSKFLSWRDPIPVIEAHSNVLAATTESDQTNVVIDFTASYVLYGGAHLNEKMELWTKTQRAVFVRKSRQVRFRLDSRQSQLSNKELDAIYAGEGPSNSQILRYNVDDLERITTSTNEKAKEWLRSYLTECRNTGERERLLKALAH
jgi:hypothetical protein